MFLSCGYVSSRFSSHGESCLNLLGLKFPFLRKEEAD